jgi:allantoinase
MSYELVIRGGTLVTPEGERRADLAVEAGRICAIDPELSGSAAETIDATGLFVLPGLVDPHVHCNEPGRTEWEGFAHATRALAAGGCTTYFDMPLNAHPPTCDAASFDAKLAAAQGQALVDFGLWGGLVPGNLGQLEELAARGVVGLKAFMSASGIDDFAAADDLTLWEGMREAARLGLLVAVHAESDAITGGLARRAIREGRTSARDYLASRPVIAELEAIRRAIGLAEETGCALHTVHVSSGRGVALVAEAQSRGVDVTCETCAHYLALTEEDVERLGAVAKCAPPLRPQAEQDALWAHIASGALSIVTSDHSPAPATMKQGDDFFAIWGGISGCQTTLQAVLLAGYEARGLEPATLAHCLAGTAARRWKLAHKGAITVGADADLALVDLGARPMVTAGELYYRHQHSPYVGMRMRGQVRRTLLRGVTVMQDGRIVGAPRGRLVTPERGLPAL